MAAVEISEVSELVEAVDSLCRMCGLSGGSLELSRSSRYPRIIVRKTEQVRFR